MQSKMKSSIFSRLSSLLHTHNNRYVYVSPSSTPPTPRHQTFSETMIEENINFADVVIRKWDIDYKNDKILSLLEHDKIEAKLFLKAVIDLQRAMHFYLKLSSNSESLIRAQNLMKTAIKRLEREFYTILSANRKNLESESVSGRSSRASTRSSITDSDSDDESTTPHASESIFGHESLSVVRYEAVAALVKLSEAVRIIFGQFEVAIQKDSSNTPLNGGIHPLTRYVMNFLVFIGDYRGTVSDILSDLPVTAHTPLPESYFSSPTSAANDPSAAAITERLGWLILVLLCKLDGKAVEYNDEALSYLFLANNLNYVVSKVRNSTLGLLMGPDWIWKHGSKVKQYVADYERMAWSKVMALLTEDPTDPTLGVAEWFGRFNSEFRETYTNQHSWVIPDPKLRDEVKVSLSKKIVPAYRVFFEKHRAVYVTGFLSESIIRFAPQTLDRYLSHMFFDAVPSEAKKTTTQENYSKSSTTQCNACGRSLTATYKILLIYLFILLILLISFFFSYFLLYIINKAH